jgi:hypothetical protein
LNLSSEGRAVVAQCDVYLDESRKRLEKATRDLEVARNIQQCNNSLKKLSSSLDTTLSTWSAYLTACKVLRDHLQGEEDTRPEVQDMLELAGLLEARYQPLNSIVKAEIEYLDQALTGKLNELKQLIDDRALSAAIQAAQAQRRLLASLQKRYRGEVEAEHILKRYNESLGDIFRNTQYMIAPILEAAQKVKSHGKTCLNRMRAFMVGQIGMSEVEKAVNEAEDILHSVEEHADDSPIVGEFVKEARGAIMICEGQLSIAKGVREQLHEGRFLQCVEEAEAALQEEEASLALQLVLEANAIMEPLIANLSSLEYVEPLQRRLRRLKRKCVARMQGQPSPTPSFASPSPDRHSSLQASRPMTPVAKNEEEKQKNMGKSKEKEKAKAKENDSEKKKHSRQKEVEQHGRSQSRHQEVQEEVQEQPPVAKSRNPYRSKKNSGGDSRKRLSAHQRERDQAGNRVERAALGRDLAESSDKSAEHRFRGRSAHSSIVEVEADPVSQVEPSPEPEGEVEPEPEPEPEVEAEPEPEPAVDVASPFNAQVTEEEEASASPVVETVSEWQETPEPQVVANASLEEAAEDQEQEQQEEDYGDDAFLSDDASPSPSAVKAELPPTNDVAGSEDDYSPFSDLDEKVPAPSNGGKYHDYENNSLPSEAEEYHNNYDNPKNKNNGDNDADEDDDLFSDDDW